MRTRIELNYATPFMLRDVPHRVRVFGDAPGIGANQHEDAFIGDSPWAATLVLIPVTQRTGLIRCVGITDTRVGLMTRTGSIGEFHPDWLSDLEPIVADVRAIFSGEVRLSAPGSAHWVDGPPDLESPE